MKRYLVIAFLAGLIYANGLYADQGNDDFDVSALAGIWNNAVNENNAALPAIVDDNLLSSPPTTAHVTQSTNQYEVIWEEDFESGYGNWFPENGVWEIGEPSSGPVIVNYATGLDGKLMAATILAGDYPRETNSRLINIVEKIHIPQKNNPDQKIQIWLSHWYSYTGGDYGQVQIRVLENETWSEWKNVGHRIVGDHGIWDQSIFYPIDISEYSGKTIQISFLHVDVKENSGLSYISSGWYIDKIRIVSVTPIFLFKDHFEINEHGDWFVDYEGVWMIGAPESGPEQAYDGSGVIATVLNGNYPRYRNSHLISPAFELPNTNSSDDFILLTFWHWFAYTGGDYGRVQIRFFEEAWSDWITIGTNYKGNSSVWTPVQIDLTDYNGKSIQIAFYHIDVKENSGLSYISSGWYIDNLEIKTDISGKSPTPTYTPTQTPSPTSTPTVTPTSTPTEIVVLDTPTPEPTPALEPSTNDIEDYMITQNKIIAHGNLSEMKANFDAFLLDTEIQVERVGEYLVWTKMLSDFDAKPGSNRTTTEPFPDDVILNFALSSEGDFYLGANGSDSSVLSAIGSLFWGGVISGIAGGFYESVACPNLWGLDDGIFEIEDVGIAGIGWSEFKLIQDKGYISGLSNNGNEFRKNSSLRLMHSFSKPIFIVYYPIFVVSGNENGNWAVDYQMNHLWNQFSSVFSNGTATRSMNLEYQGEMASYLYCALHNNNSEESWISIDDEKIAHLNNWGVKIKKLYNQYPESVELGARKTWSQIDPAITITVVADQVNVVDWHEEPSQGERSNPSPDILVLYPGIWNDQNEPVLETPTPVATPTEISGNLAVFEDDFEDPDYTSANWSPYGSAFSVSGGVARLYPDGSVLQPIFSNRKATMHDKGQEPILFGDMEYSVDVKLTGGRRTYLLFGGAEDDLLFEIGYDLGSADLLCRNHMENKSRKAGTYEVVNDFRPYDGNWHRWTVRIMGADIRFLVDDQLIIEGILDNYQPGPIGMRAWDGGGTHFDNLRVSSLGTESTPTPTVTPELILTDTPTPELVASPTPSDIDYIDPIYVYPMNEFTESENDLLIMNPAGYDLGNYLFDSLEAADGAQDYTNGFGMKVNLGPGSGITAFGKPLTVEPDSYVFLRISAFCKDPNVSLAVGALDAVESTDISGAALNGSIGSNMLTESSRFVESFGYLETLFMPERGAVVPVFQAVNAAGNSTRVQFDNLEIYVIPKDRFPIRLKSAP